MDEKGSRKTGSTVGITEEEQVATPRIGRRQVQTSEGETPATTPHDSVMAAEDAAHLLFEFLPKDVTDVFDEASKILDIPSWKLMLGFIMRCYDQMLLQSHVYSPYMLSSWDSGLKLSQGRICENCNANFETRFPDARFCCSRCYFKKVDEFGHDADCPAKRN